MNGGIVITTEVASGILSIAGSVVRTGQNLAAVSTIGGKIWTPPQFSKQKALYSIVVQDTGGDKGSSTDADGNFVLQAQSKSTVAMYVFDAMLAATHEISATATTHPLQTGVNISDHIYLNQYAIQLEVGMSDAMAAYSTGMWSGNTSKSVAAFQKMVELLENRALLTLNTRLKTYQNCVLLNIRSIDNSKYYHGASMQLTFRQLRLVTVANQYNSARSNTTGSTQLGSIQGTEPDSTTINQHEVDTPTTVMGAGNFSSNNVTNGGS